MKEILLAIILSVAILPCSAKAQSSSDNFTNALRKARQECWQLDHHAPDPNSNLVKCENTAIKNLLSNALPVYQQVPLHAFLNKRLQIAGELDQQQITANQYQIKLAESAEEFQRQLQGKSL